MRRFFYPKLAVTGIQKNKQFYTPYTLTCAGMVMMFYIISFLSNNQALQAMRGGAMLQQILVLGVGVIAVFAMIFLFYTNSFLIRRRKKEFGLYNILGMGKGNLTRVLLWETIFVALISMVGGLVAGIALSKLAELALVNLIQGKVSFSMHVDVSSVMHTLAVFSVIFVLILLNTLRQIHLSNPIELLQSERTGEKPPKANWFVALLGAGLLGGAYYLAVKIQNPVQALAMFFVAVLMVIVATYLLFIAGSVTVCKLLQKNKGYYYKTNHFVSVSSMVYRMKRNGAGLASICILSTMVLVMLSSTVCLYIGAEDVLHTRYPRSINVDLTVDQLPGLVPEEMQAIRQAGLQAAASNGQKPESIVDYRTASVFAYYEPDGSITLETNGMQALQEDESGSLVQLFFLPLEDYNKTMNKNETLKPGEALLYTDRAMSGQATIRIGDGQAIAVKKTVHEFVSNRLDAMQIIPSMHLVVPDLAEAVKPLEAMKDVRGKSLLEIHWFYGYDLNASDAVQRQTRDQFEDAAHNLVSTPESRVTQLLVEGIASERADFYGLYGGLFFLGVLLGIVFMFAAVLIMYYKQISEGHEDQSRFEIMQKVGMTKKDIQRSVNSQVLTVFFLPLVTAGVHLAFAFPMLQKMLLIFGLPNKSLLILAAMGSFLLFAVFYVVVYHVTSKAHYKIVSGAHSSS